jgi:CHAT domain-containing protein/tetratricopeptide (TPR) repeat protein
MINRSFRSAAATLFLVLAVSGSGAYAAPDYNAMLRRFLQLYQEGKADEAMAEALKFEAVAKAAFGVNHTNYAIALNHLGMAHALKIRLKEAESYYRRALAIWEKTNSPHTTLVLNNLAGIYSGVGRHTEALEAGRRVLAIFEKAHGRNHPNVAGALGIVGAALSEIGRLDEAETVIKRRLEIHLKEQSQRPMMVAAAYEGLAGVYWKQDKHAAAEAYFKQALAVRTKGFGADHPFTAESLHNLGLAYEGQGRYGDAEVLYKQAQAILEKHKHASLGTAYVSLGRLQGNSGKYAEADAFYEKASAALTAVHGPDSLALAPVFGNWGSVRASQRRYAEAESYLRRSLLLYEKGYGPDSADVARSLSNIAVIFTLQGKRAEADASLRRALDIQTKIFGSDHSSLQSTLTNIGNAHFYAGEYDKADVLYRRVLDIAQKNLGPDNPAVGLALRNLAGNDIKRGNFSDAEIQLQRSLEIYEKSYGTDHVILGEILSKLAETYRSEGRLDEARATATRALALVEKAAEATPLSGNESAEELAVIEDLAGKPSMALNHMRQVTSRLLSHAESESRGKSGDGGVISLAQKGKSFRRHLASAASVAATGGQASADLKQEAFEIAQWSVQSSAGSAVQQMALRFASGSGRLGELVRESQDLTAFLKDRDKTLIDALSVPEAKRNKSLVETVRRQGADAERKLTDLTARIGKEFPEYAELTAPKPLKAADIQQLLAADEALLFWVTGDAQAERLDAAEKHQSYVFAVTREGFEWKTIDLGAQALAEKVAEFRNGLDVVEFRDSVAAGKPKLFNLEIAHALYDTLIAPVASVLKDKRQLLVVPSGALTALPIHLLVTEKPAKPVTNVGDVPAYRDAAWLLKSHAVAVLPSVGSLKALRVFAQEGQATKPMIGFGDPVFSPAQAASAKKEQRTKVAAKTRSYSDYWNGAGVDREQLAKALPRLEESADELKAVAEKVGADGADIHLREAASESNVKRTALSDFQIVYFATHGLVAGDIKGLAEPSLALSLPKTASDLDDGLLTASEIAHLKLNADWVVLSACNTIAGDKPGAEALSGLARAFFFAGARSLLVSHWTVDSAAATRLAISSFDAIKSDPKAGRAEALRKAMLAYMNDNSSAVNAHPAFWGPFALIGEGAARSR